MLESDIKIYCGEIYPELKYHYILVKTDTCATVKMTKSDGIHLIEIENKKLIKYFRKNKLNKILK